jgi:DnaJ-class molecular chaperone
MAKDLYSVLGVGKTAAAAEIKSAYRRLARKYHPDVNKDNPSADERFKEISSAYDILGDVDKRKKYDNNEIDADGKPTGFGAGFGNGGGNYSSSENHGGGGFYSARGADFDFSSIFGEDIFSAFSGGSSRRGGFGSNGGRARKGEDIAYTMRIDFLSAVKGAEQQVTIGGRGVNVKIPAGTVDGKTLRLKGLGKPGHFGGESGDVLITLNVDKHPYFSLDGLNIVMELSISLKEAILGAKVTVPTVDGKVAVKVPPYASSGDKLRLKGKGIKNKSLTGDQIMTLKIISPKSRDSELEKALQSMSDEEIRNF